MRRPEGRKNNELREITIENDINKHAEGSALITFGDTKVICTATIESRLPPWMKAQGITGKGWITAEYGMLPRSTGSRMDRESIKGQTGRTKEIQRLIARALRACIDLKELGEIQVKIDCDVIQADGGTRVSSICGAYVALYQALKKLKKLSAIKTSIAAVSCGIIDGEARLDLDYEEDSAAEVDANFVMTGDGKLVEVQATGEEMTFSQEQLSEMLELAKEGISKITEKQKEVVDSL